MLGLTDDETEEETLLETLELTLVEGETEDDTDEETEEDTEELADVLSAGSKETMLCTHTSLPAPPQENAALAAVVWMM